MTNEPLAIEFYETLSGVFALGATDPAEGASAGGARGTSMTLHNAITISDIDQFYRDPEHRAELTVILDFTPFERGIECYGGTIQLFKPGGEQGLKLMVYRFGFEWNETPYFFEGRKHIHGGSSARQLWAETTRLRARLYEGHDDRGMPVGAGILHIGVRGVMELVRSMRVISAESAVQRAEILARFGGFLFGEMWGAYRGHLAGGQD